MRHLARFLPVVLCLCASSAALAASGYTISTFKNGQLVGARKVSNEELRAAATGMASAFQQASPSHDQLLAAARSLTAKERCFNLYGGRLAAASVEAGKIDTSVDAEAVLQDSIATLTEINNQTHVTCDMK
jgi:hypothetical protein